MLSAVLLVPGVLAIVDGDEVSAALSKIAADSMSRLRRILFVVGSMLTLGGIARNRALTEAVDNERRQVSRLSAYLARCKADLAVAESQIEQLTHYGRMSARHGRPSAG